MNDAQLKPVNVYEAADRMASADNEATAAPWWAIICPNMLDTKPGKKRISAIAHAVVGPFFSREDAERHRQSRIYEYGDSSRVYCLSGYWSGKYSEFGDAVTRAMHRFERKIEQLETENAQLKTELAVLKGTGNVG